MTEVKKELTLRIPDELFQIIKTYKEKTGVQYTNFIYNAIVWYALSRGLIGLDYFKKDDVRIRRESQKD